MNNKTIDLGKDPIHKIFIHYAIPSTLSMLSMIIAYIIDGIFIGRYVGQYGLAAINLCYPVYSFYSGVAIMVGTGGVTMANIKRGEQDENTANKYFTFTNLILLVFGLLSIIIGLITLKKMIFLVNILKKLLN